MNKKLAYVQIGWNTHVLRWCLPVLSLLLLLAACGDTTASSPTPTPAETPTATTAPTPTPTTASSGPSAAVTITGSAGSYAFSPATLQITVGTTVTWTNRSQTLHTVTSDTGLFDTTTDKALDTGQTFSFTFTKAGTYAYHCDFHASMKATIVVK